MIGAGHALAPAARAPELVGEAVVERVVGGVDDVGARRRPSTRSRRLVAGLDHHARHRAGAGLRRQDADLVVGEPDVFELGESRRSAPCAAPSSSALTGPLLSATSMNACSPTVALDGRLRHGDELALGVPAPLVHDAEALQPEIFRHAAERAPRQQLEARLGAVIGIALRTRAPSPRRAARRASDAWRRSRCRSRAAAPGCSSARPDRRRRCGADCRPAPGSMCS